MADEIIPPVVEEKVDYDYKDIHEPTVREIAEGKEAPEDPKIEEKKEEIKVVEAVVETPKEEPKADLEEQKRIAQEAAEAAANKVIEAQKPKEEEKSEYQKIVEEYKAKENRAPTWEELAAKLEDRAADKAIQRIEETKRLADEEQQKQQTQAKEQEDARIKETNAFVDEELADLYDAGKLTKIVDPNNPSDQGVVERKALFQKMLDLNVQRQQEGKRPIYSVKTIYYEHYTKPSAQPAGENAPVMRAKSSATPPSEENNYTYQDLKKPWYSFARK